MPHVLAQVRKFVTWEVVQMRPLRRAGTQQSKMQRGSSAMKSTTYRDWVPLAKLTTAIPLRTLQRWAENGTIRAQKFGKKWYVHLPDLIRQRGFEQLANEIITRHTRQ